MFHTILPVEVKERDLRSRALLACLVAKNFGSAFIGYKGITEKMAYYCPPSVFISRGVEKPTWYPRLLATLRKAGTVCCVHDVEAGAALHTPDVFREIRAPLAAANLLNYWAAWSRAEQNLLKEHLGSETTCKVITVGKPGWCKPSQSKPLSNGDQTLLICLSEKLDSINKEGSQSISSMVAERVKDASIIEAYKNNKDLRRRLNSELLQLCESSDLIDLKVVLRPHFKESKESIEELSKRFSGYANITVDSKSSLRSGIERCRFLVSAQCMTTYDAVANGRIPIRLEGMKSTVKSECHRNVSFVFDSAFKVVEFLGGERWSAAEYSANYKSVLAETAQEIPSFGRERLDAEPWEVIFHDVGHGIVGAQGSRTAISKWLVAWAYRTYKALQLRNTYYIIKTADVRACLVDDADALDGVLLKQVGTGVCFSSRVAS